MANKNFIVALDQMNRDDLFAFLKEHGQELKFIKLGMELYYRHGPDLVHELAKTFPHLGLFLDLKLHDIPKTVERAISSLEGLPIKFLTLHLQGGKEMVEYALRARETYLPKTKLLGVTVLTSLSDFDTRDLYERTIKEVFKNLVHLALDTDIDGLVCSPLELDLLTQWDPSHQLLRVTPGIRFHQEMKADQKRVMDPQLAWSKGADYLVIGRPITQAQKPGKVIEELNRSPE
jgi:orotidine-5'-phosphate decarboxylase